MPILQKVVKGIGSGIGLASEAIADHKDRKATQTQAVSPRPSGGEGSASTSRTAARHDVYPEEKRGRKGERERGLDGKHDSDSDSSSVSTSDLDNDRAEWALDEAAQQFEQPPPSYRETEASSSSPNGPASAEEFATAFLRTHKVATATVASKTYQPLPCPVILPQRRPKDKSRGFVRAYAPLLGSCADIDQQTFIDFLNDLDRASRASPVFNVINVACFAVGFVPSPIAMGVSIAVQAASRTAQEVQTRYRRNTYLDQINETLFKPRGLYCMIMTFKPDSPYEPVIGMDVRSTSTDAALAKATSNPDSELRQKLKSMRLTSGTSKGEMSLPESAPLVYPALDAALSEGTELSEPKQTGLRASAGFVANYLDRRAQASHAGMYPDGKLAAAAPGEKKFASRFSDPNHPANSGTILGLLSGGNFDPQAKRRAHKAQRRAHRRGYELSETDLKNAEMGRLPRRRQGVVRRVLQQDVLYLTIVNLPSESEMREMLQELERARK
ncbi:hypothetical protein A1O1_07302 [Capronia coronata CBS 617.96]|uniref:Uncharacterized protein n=1 Tax=Capronia coronata CBS 617.96 TaxID=1182541 RepID=W9XTW5_9EURO|nr:uncharacterized protein A1O1_07302 [Capronia coronata CBS 617.96]EXJ83678.1 hypothetical protein A1O1_07302 [Capronia coronata CBS 617.96]